MFIKFCIILVIDVLLTGFWIFIKHHLFKAYLHKLRICEKYNNSIAKLHRIIQALEIASTILGWICTMFAIFGSLSTFETCFWVPIILVLLGSKLYKLVDSHYPKISKLLKDRNKKINANNKDIHSLLENIITNRDYITSGEVKSHKKQKTYKKIEKEIKQLNKKMDKDKI